MNKQIDFIKNLKQLGFTFRRSIINILEDEFEDKIDWDLADKLHSIARGKLDRPLYWTNSLPTKGLLRQEGFINANSLNGRKIIENERNKLR